MNNIICNRLFLTHCSEIEKMDADQISFSPEKDFTEYILEGSANYQNQSQSPDPGSICNETVTAKIKYREDLFFIKFPLQYYVLKLYTDTGDFIVGSLEYPALISFSTDKKFVNLTFKVSRPQ